MGIVRQIQFHIQIFLKRMDQNAEGFILEHMMSKSRKIIRKITVSFLWLNNFLICLIILHAKT